MASRQSMTTAAVAADSREPRRGVLAPFVPRLALELAGQGVPTWNNIDGSMLSADISGFTALSEKLAGKGKAGAEEITGLINTCFTALIDAAYRHDGEVIKFGGDALLILFRGDRHQRRSANAGLAMQGALRSSAAAKRADLTMTVGVAEGPFDVFLVGSDYRELLVTGPRASEVIRLEGEAAKGDTLVAPSIASHLPATMNVREESGGVVIIGSSDDELIGPDTTPPPSDSDLTHYVPRQVREQLAAFSDLGGEHRLVAVGFVMVTGVAAALDDLGPTGVATALGDVVDAVAAAGDEFGVTLLHTDIAPDGVKFVVCAGAPLNPGDTADAMLRAALRIAEVRSPFVIRQGVQSGRVFAGFLGSPFRRTYTLMGDPVNTAARMLGPAGDREVVAVATVLENTRTVFNSEALEPFLVKGKSEPIVAHRIRSATDQVRGASGGPALIGRAEEVDVVLSAIERLDRVVEIVGPAGVGKSRLVEAATSSATLSDDVSQFRGSCTPYGGSSPYSAFRPIVREGSGIPLEADGEVAGELLSRLVGSTAPHLLPMLPLLAVPFGALVPSTPEADAIDPRFRRARVHDLVVEFLDALAPGPLLLVLEDAHWIDDASAELLDHLVAESAQRPWAAVITRRPESRWQLDDAPEHVVRIELSPLEAEEIRRLVIGECRRALSDSELGAIVGRSAGNPLFAIELTRAVTTGGTRGVELPDSVEVLIASRIDALAPDARRLVRIASVFGTQSTVEHLAAVARSEGVDAHVGDPALGDILVRRSTDEVAFTQALYRDTAYEGLPFQQRRRLHELVADTLAAGRDDLRPIAALLALHFGEARRHREAYAHATVAAADAMAVYAHREAAELLERALRSGRYRREVDATARAGLYEQLGRSLEYAGELPLAEKAYQRVRGLTDDLDVTVNVMRRQARIRQKQNRLTSAIRLLATAERLLTSAEQHPWVHHRLAEMHLNLAGIRMDQGRLDEARHHGELAEQHAAMAGDDALRVQAYGAIVGSLSSWDEAQRYVEPGLGDSAPTDAYEARSILAINLGMCAYFAGQWDQAVQFYELGRDAADAMGNVTAGALAAMNLAEVLVDQGHLEPALDALAHVQRILGAAGYHAALLYADLLQGTAEVRLGRLDDALPRLQRCAEEFRAGSMQLYALEAELRMAEAHLQRRDLRTASTLTAQVIEAAASTSRQGVVLARAERLSGLVALAEGDAATAQSLLTAALARCRGEGLRYELALTASVLAEIAEDGQPLRVEAEQIFDELGVVAGQRYWNSTFAV
jgi:predicted ATPase/class 3 adenylate cyclase